MKTKYERLNKEEKRRVYESFKKDKIDLSKKLNKMFILCYVGMVYGLGIFFYDFFISKSKLNYILDIIVFAFCLISILKLYSVRKNLLNKYVLDNKKRF